MEWLIPYNLEPNEPDADEGHAGFHCAAALMLVCIQCYRSYPFESGKTLHS